MDELEAFYEEVGKRIRAARKRRKPKITQDELGKLVGLTRTSITNLEQGRQKCLLHTLAEIAVALDVEPGTLIPTQTTPYAGLGDALKNRPSSEKTWIMATVKAVQSEKNENGT